MSESPRILIIGDVPRTSTPSVFGFFSEWQWEFYRSKLIRAGIRESDIEFKRLSNITSDNLGYNLVITLGDRPLNQITGKSSVEKYHATPLYAHDKTTKVIPTFDQLRVQRDWSIGTFVDLAFAKAKKFSEHDGPFPFRKENFLLNPPFEEKLSVLRKLKEWKIPLAVDVETGRGQINTVGFAWSSEDAIAMNVLPENYGPANFHILWEHIESLLSDSEIPKIYQNFIYDTQWFSMYGIPTRGIRWDTMFAQKFLWPEFKSNLGMVGRIYTDRPYWKDDGKVVSEEAEKRDWGTIRNWPDHYRYNCRDTTGTFEAHLAQRQDLILRDLYTPFKELVLSLIPGILEMTTQGLPFSETKREKARESVQAELDSLTKDWHTYCDQVEVNPGSPKQLMKLLKDKGFKIPKIYDGSSKTYRESVGEKGIKKLRLKYPKEEIFDHLIRMAKLRTARNRYINFRDRGDSRIYYTINGHGTETGRFSSGKDSFGFGINAQTNPHAMPGFNFKSMIEALPGFEFVQVDLKQAESRFVAYDSADHKLISFLENPKLDVHKYMASKIYGIPESNVTKAQRQLGKKSGHGANYNMKAGIFVETCLSEMDLVLSKKEAEHILKTYYEEFPGIPRWHLDIRKELSNTRRLRTPLGRERYFYGRLGDDMFREGYAYRPQSTVPDVTNQMMLHCLKWRDEKRVPFALLLQVHDSLLFHCEKSATSDLVQVLSNTNLWHPEILLPGGKLVIPTEVEVGPVLSEMRETS